MPAKASRDPQERQRLGGGWPEPEPWPSPPVGSILGNVPDHPWVPEAQGGLYSRAIEYCLSHIRKDWRSPRGLGALLGLLILAIFLFYRALPEVSAAIISWLVWLLTKKTPLWIAIVVAGIPYLLVLWFRRSAPLPSPIPAPAELVPSEPNGNGPPDHQKLWNGLSERERQVMIWIWRHDMAFVPEERVAPVRRELGAEGWNTLEASLTRRQLVRGVEGLQILQAGRDLMEWVAKYAQPEAARVWSELGRDDRIVLEALSSAEGAFRFDQHLKQLDGGLAEERWNAILAITQTKDLVRWEARKPFRSDSSYDGRRLTEKGRLLMAWRLRNPDSAEPPASPFV